MAKKKTIDFVIEYVQDNARCAEDSPDKKYHVRYPTPYAGKLFCSDDTRDLVLQIMQEHHRNAVIPEWY